MKLIKLEDSHYVIITDDEIKIDDIVLETYVDGSKGLEHIQTLNDIHPLLHKKVTHTSIPIVGLSFIDKDEVKELLGEVDVEKKADDFITNELQVASSSVNRQVKVGFEAGYNQALEDNKNRKYTEKDLRAVFMHGFLLGVDRGDYSLDMENRALSTYTQPPTQWDVEFVDGKLKLI